MLAFFDFYPVISKADSFFDLYEEAMFWAVWNFWNLTLLLLSLIFSWFLSRFISLNTLSWSFFLSFCSLFILGIGEFIFREQFNLLRGAGKLSDQLLFITQSVMVMWVILIPMVLASLIFRKTRPPASAHPLGQRFQSLSKWRQRILLTLFATTLFSYPFLHFPLLLLTFLVLSYMWLKKVQISPALPKPRWSDLIPLGSIALILLSLSWINVEKVVQSIPFFNTYF